ncbi:N-acetyllactosaminide beta-1,3-N-acetylglucosaminyltransferase 2-like [Mizuhopecten yessoensis]|uniref:Lactosylceramide 1,3-N-acetyl-beta-D-glucosaminyltransferase n=1 Tax=Mizuhopecten yessoensis TaxID=6573 RepID=A0A210PEB2_MIZYE|nr:N-acetyllactosaminide beta-1,3-N-acetylglucosaminyltransferase 2-like [Mizuhopecten yessoensis]OWF34822.1 Lactosylceramide 1,3-N-acetyl-beta-D-glucosaminyltransferase [Mizuhopecten yessoensis]
MAGPLDAVMELTKYTPAFMRRKLLSRRYIYICIIIALSFASVITFGIFQTNLKTNKEQIDVIRQWREITQGDSLDSPSVEFRDSIRIDQHKDTGKVHYRNLKETKKTGHIGAESKDNNEGNAGRGQPVNKQVEDTDKNKLLFKNNLKTLQHKEKKRMDNKLGLENHVKEMDVIPHSTENKDTIQEHSEEEPQDNFGKEGAIKEKSHDSNMGYRQENEEEKEKQHLIDSLSRLLAKLDDKDIDTDLEQKLFADVEDSKHLPGFDPKLYPQKLDIPKLLNDFAQTGDLPDHAINKWAFHPIINPSNVCGEPGVQSKVFLLFIVKTKPDNFVKRRTIRKTWADPVRFPNIRTVFSVGVPKSSNTMKKLKTESMKYKDVLLMDYIDSYYNLTLKTTSDINWAVAHCSMADFVVSIDDDIYMATDLLIQHLQDVPKTEAERLYMGYVYKDTMPVRKETSNAYIEKWIISEKEYAFSTYPDYIFGGCIIMSMRTVVEMYMIIPYTKPIVMEDVYVGILASRLGITPSHTDLIDVYVTYSNTEKFKTLIASHYYKTSHMLRQAWECHLSIVNNDVEKAVFCSYLKEELQTLRDHVSTILDWVDLSNDAI